MEITGIDIATAPSLHAAISARVKIHPDAIAVEFEGQSLTYVQLERRSNQLARVLQLNGVRQGVLVGLAAERSLETIVSLLAILKAGGAYVPLDRRHGQARINHIIEAAQPGVMVGDAAFCKTLASAVTCIEPSGCAMAEASSAALDSSVGPSDLAYVIFTSGSTGSPKGVEVEHRSLLNFFESMLQQPGFSAPDTLLAVTTIAFDIAGLELYLPLLAGGCVVIVGSDAASDGKQLIEALKRSNATVMQATPATWQLLFASGWQGAAALKVLVGGEALSAGLGRRLADSCSEVWNMYGPTETTIWSSLYRMDGRDDRIVPIGKPILNTSLHILADDLKPVGPQQEGELYIGGAGLARGYLHRPDLTAERFVADPFSSLPGARLYRTGDVVRRRADGNLEFLGRTDHQVKIQGFRIELGEIESILERHPAVRQAAAIAREDGTGEKHIIAYVSLGASKPDAIAELRRYLRENLPPYMLPAAVVELKDFPLTANGKTDRNAFPAPSSTDLMTGHEYVAPRNASEKTLVAIWEEVLNISPIGVTVSFFDLGGRSLQAARVFMRIGREFGRDLPVSTLFHAADIETLAKELKDSAERAYQTVIPIKTQGSRQPFFCVHGGLGSTLFLRNLANEMHSEQPFFGIEPEGLDGKAFERLTVQAMAEHYLSEIRKIQPHGPYRIGGYCFGGIVAVEMARQLLLSGQEAALVALFNAPLRFNRPRPCNALPVSPEKAGHFRRLTHRCHRIVLRKITRLKIKVAFAFLRLGRRVPQILRGMYVDQMLRQAEWQYNPQPYGGILHLFRGRGLYDKDPDMGWDELASGIEHRIIGGATTFLRREIMDEPLVTELANELTKALESVVMGSNKSVSDSGSAVSLSASR